MIYIAHRGNLNGKDITKENTINQISKCLDLNIDVEIDLWYKLKKFMLGHDSPMYDVSIEFLHKYANRLWCHAKNEQALFELQKYNLNYFWHENDKYTITSKGFLWVYPGNLLNTQSICVMPEIANYSIQNLNISYGICSDNILYYQKFIGK